MNTKKITLATLKSFIRKNSDKLYINLRSKFSGMTDGIEKVGNSFEPVTIDNEHVNASHTLGIAGAWIVGSSRDWLSHYEDETYTGIDVSNSCGHFILAIKK